MTTPWLLLRLPLELQYMILNYLSRPDLPSITLVCKAAQNLIEPIFYGKLMMHWWRDRPPRLDLLLRALLNRPELCSNVHSVRLWGMSFRTARVFQFRRSIPRLCINSLPMDKATAFIKAFGLSRSRTNVWLKEISAGSIDALVSLLLALLPNLEHLYLGPVYTVRNQILGDLLRHCLCKRNVDKKENWPFRRLMTVEFLPRCNDWEYNGRHSTADVLPFFYAPMLELIVISIDNPSKFVWPTDPPNLTNLQYLDTSRLREQRILPILSILPNLKRLRWEWFYQASLDKHVMDNTADLDAITSMLGVVRNSVTDLRIRARCEPSPGDQEFPFVIIRASLCLADFHCVTKLDVPWVFWMGWSPSQGKSLLQHLPQNIQLLTFTWGLEDFGPYNWDIYPRRGNYQRSDDEDPFAIIRTIILALQKLKRSRLPDFHTLVLVCQVFGPVASNVEQDAELKRISHDPGVKVIQEETERIRYYSR